MRISLIKLILLMGLVVSVSSCLLVREDLYDIHEDDTSQQGTGTATAGITVDTGDGLITKEHPATPLSDTFTVVLDTEPTATVTLGTIQSLDTGEVTVSPSSLTFTTANWDTPQTVTVTGVDDVLTDDMQTVIIDLGTASGGDYTGIDPGDVTVNNLDDETPSAPMVLLITGDGLVTAEHPTTPLSDTFNVALNSAPTADVILSTIQSSDTGEVTVSPSSLTFTTGNWATPQTITVTGVDDLTNDGMQTIPVNLGNASSTDPNWNGLSAGSVTVHNLDDDAPKGITVISGQSMLVSESGGASTFTVVLDSAPSADVSIDVSSSNTFEGVVTSPAAGTLTFTSGNWNTPQTVTVIGVDNALSDGNQSFTVVLDPAISTDVGYNGMNPSDVTYMNIDDDIPGITVFAGSPVIVSENGSSSTFDVVLNSQPSSDVSINVSSDTPSEGTVSTGSITFTNGNWNVKQTISVTGVNDPDIDGNQAFTVILDLAASTDTGYNGIDPDDVSFINVDNDAPGITVNAGLTMLVSENGSWSSFEVVLNAPPTANVDIGVWSNNVAEGDVSIPASGTLTFDAGNWSNPQTVQVAGVNDDSADGNQSFSVVLDPAISTDGNYNGIDPPNVSFINADDDTPGITVFAGSSLIVFEGGSSCCFEVVLNSQPSTNVDVNVWSDDTSEGDVTIPASGTLSFTSGNWNIPQSVTISSADDGIVDGSTPFNVVLDPATGDAGYTGIDPDDVSFTCIDDDSPAVKDIVVIAAPSMLVSENGGSSSFDVVLTAAPTNDVDINAYSDTPLEGDVTSPPLGAIQFTPLNWNIPKTVTVTGQDDPVVDGNQPFSVILDPATSLDPGYNGIDPNDVPHVNVDDDAPGITVSAGSLMLVSEKIGSPSSTFEVVLNSEPSADVTINLGVSDATEGTVAPLSLTFTDADWDSPQTVTVTGVDDSVVDGNVSFWVILNPAAGAAEYIGIDPDDVLYTNIDDDAPGITVSIGDGLVTKEHPTAPLQDTFSVVLNSEPAGNVTIPISSGDTSEVTVSDASITFTPADWDSAQIITVTGVDDLLADDYQAVNITLGAASTSPLDSNYELNDPDDVTVYNLDDEAMPEVIVLGSGSPAGYITTENGATAKIQVVLSAQPTADVTLGTISSDTPTEGIVNPPLNTMDITFTPATWDCPQTITVYGVDDAIDADVGYKIDLGFTSSTDLLWDGIDPGDVEVTNMEYKTLTGVNKYGWMGLPNVEAGSFTTLQGNGTSTLITPREVNFYDGYDAKDEGYEYVPIGFTFYYVGMPYDQVTVYTNGFISFSPYHKTTNTFANDYLFDNSADANEFQNILAPWWDDLDVIAVGSGMYYETTGTAPNRTFTIEWHEALCHLNPPASSDDTYTFQIKLHESTNVIEFIYGLKSNVDATNDSSASVGVKDHIGGSTHFIEGVDGVTTSPPPPDSSKTVTDFPTFDSVIRFTP